MYQYLGADDAERQKNLKLFRDWVGQLDIEKIPGTDKERPCQHKGRILMTAFIASLIFVVLAEMADKTQLLAMAFACKFRCRRSCGACLSQTAVNHLMAAAAGSYLAAIVPMATIKIAAAVSFIIFGLWTIRGDYPGGRRQEVSFQPFLDGHDRLFHGRDGRQDPACDDSACC